MTKPEPERDIKEGALNAAEILKEMGFEQEAKDVAETAAKLVKANQQIDMLTDHSFAGESND